MNLPTKPMLGPVVRSDGVIPPIGQLKPTVAPFEYPQLLGRESSPTDGGLGISNNNFEIVQPTLTSNPGDFLNIGRSITNQERSLWEVGRIEGRLGETIRFLEGCMREESRAREMLVQQQASHIRTLQGQLASLTSRQQAHDAALQSITTAIQRQQEALTAMTAQTVAQCGDVRRDLGGRFEPIESWMSAMSSDVDARVHAVNGKLAERVAKLESVLDGLVSSNAEMYKSNEMGKEVLANLAGLGDGVARRIESAVYEGNRVVGEEALRVLGGVTQAVERAVTEGRIEQLRMIERIETETRARLDTIETDARRFADTLAEKISDVPHLRERIHQIEDWRMDRDKVTAGDMRQLIEAVARIQEVLVKQKEMKKRENEDMARSREEILRELSNLRKIFHAEKEEMADKLETAVRRVSRPMVIL